MQLWNCASPSIGCSSAPELAIDRLELPGVSIWSDRGSITVSTSKVSSLMANWNNSFKDQSRSSFNRLAVYVSRTSFLDGSLFYSILRRRLERLLTRSFSLGYKKLI